MSIEAGRATRAPASAKCYENTENAGLLAILPPLKGLRILDLGCGAGATAAAMQDRGAAVYGVTISHTEACRASRRILGVVVADLSRSIPFSSAARFDLVVLSHVLEHLYDPHHILALVRPLLAPGGSVAVAVPSISHYSVRLRLLRGEWTYGESGIFDWTHVRFYSRHGILAVFRHAGYEVRREAHDGTFPLGRFRKLLPAKIVRAVNARAVRVRPELFATQFVYLLTPSTETASG